MRYKRCCKGWLFAVQKVLFRAVKGGFLRPERRSFANLENLCGYSAGNLPAKDM